MAMNSSYLNSLATHGAGLITHIGLFDSSGKELTGGTPAYARKPITWTAPVNGVVRPTVDLVFSIPANSTVASWQGFNALTAGTSYGGSTFASTETYANQGEFKLTATSSGITHSGVA